MRHLHEAVRDWKPCSVCGRAAPYVQLVASEAKAKP